MTGYFVYTGLVVSLLGTGALLVAVLVWWLSGDPHTTVRARTGILVAMVVVLVGYGCMSVGTVTRNLMNETIQQIQPQRR